MRGGGRPLLLLLHGCEQSYVFTQFVPVDQEGIAGAEVNVGSKGCGVYRRAPRLC